MTNRFTTLAAALALVAGNALAEEVTVVSWGGSYQEAQSKAMFQPVAKALGMELKEESYGGLSDLRLKVKAGAVTWDIVDMGSGTAYRAANEGLVEPLDYDMIDASTMIEGTAMPKCVGTIVFSTVFAYNTETYPENGPQTWADFWDVEKFPGKRAYRGKAWSALEPALLADGVPPEEIYEVMSSEEGIQRAIDKIAELKPHIAVWWTSGAQHAQLMKDGEVDMSTGWNGRFDVAIKDGAKAKYNYDGGILDFDCFAIPVGAPNKDGAMKFLAEASKGEYQAEQTKYITYGPTNSTAYATGIISDEAARALPSHPDNAKNQMVVNNEWYGKWEQIASAMYQDMITE